MVSANSQVFSYINFMNNHDPVNKLTINMLLIHLIFHPAAVSIIVS